MNSITGGYVRSLTLSDSLSLSLCDFESGTAGRQLVVMVGESPRQVSLYH